MRRSRSSSNGRVRRVVGLCAVALSACLNPMPDDFPNTLEPPDEEGRGNADSPAVSPGVVTGGGEEQSPSDVLGEQGSSGNENLPDAGVAGDAGPGGSSGRP